MISPGKLLLLTGCLLATGLPCAAGASEPARGTFRGTVYQVDTVYNFVDVIMPGGTKRFYAAPSSIVHVHHQRAALIDIAMGEEVSGTYRTDGKIRKLVTIDDLTAR